MAVRTGYEKAEVRALSDRISQQASALVSGLPAEPLGTIRLSCTFDRCIDPEALPKLCKTPPPDIGNDLFGQYFGGVAATKIEQDAEARNEAHVIVTHVLACLGIFATLSDDEARAYYRAHFYLYADYLVPFLFKTGFVANLPSHRRDMIVAYLMDVARYCIATGARALENALCYLTCCGGKLNELIDEFRSGRPLRHLRFWSALAGSHVSSATERATTAEDFHLFLRGMPLPDRDQLLAALEAPETQRVIERFAFGARDPEWLTYLSHLLDWRDMSILATRHSEYPEKRI